VTKAAADLFRQAARQYDALPASEKRSPWWRESERVVERLGDLIDESPSLLPAVIELTVAKAHQHHQQGRLRKAVEAAGRDSRAKHRPKRWTAARYAELLHADRVLRAAGIVGPARQRALYAVFHIKGQSLANALTRARTLLLAKAARQ